MGAFFGMLILWAISMVVLILVIAQGVRVGMRWSRRDEVRERKTAGVPYRPGESVFNYRPEQSENFKPRKDFN